MATLEKRVQVLFDEELYERVVEEAAALKTSVGALIRAAVEERLDRRGVEARAALKRLWARADAHPSLDPIDLEAEKDAVERDFLRGIA
jgi:hypothetical protein